MSIISVSWKAETQFEIILTKKLERPYLKNKADMVVHNCNPIYSAGRDKKIMVRG
jgi:hypothetical protein